MFTKLAKRHITIATTTVLVFLTWAGVAYQIHEQERQSVEAQKNLLHNIASGLRDHVQSSFRSTDDVLKLLKFHYETTGIKDLSIVNNYFRNKAIDISSLNQVGVIDENGVYIFSNLDNHKKIDLSDREHFKVHKQGYSFPFFVSKPVLGRASGKWSFQITRKLEKPDGSFNGVVVASFNPVQFLEQFQRAGLNSSSLIGLVGMDGYARALRVRNTNRVEDTLKDLQLPLEVGQTDSGGFFSASFFDTTERLYVFEKVPNQPLFVIVGVSSDIALKDAHQHRNMLLVFGVLSTLFVLALTWQYLQSLENCRQMEIEAFDQRQARNLLQSNYDECVQNTKRLDDLATTAIALMQKSKSMVKEIQLAGKNIADFEDSIDSLEMIFQESLRVDLDHASANEFVINVQRLSTSKDLEKLRQKLTQASQVIDQATALLQDMESHAND